MQSKSKNQSKYTEKVQLYHCTVQRAWSYYSLSHYNKPHSVTVQVYDCHMIVYTGPIWQSIYIVTFASLRSYWLRCSRLPCFSPHRSHLRCLEDAHAIPLADDRWQTIPQEVLYLNVYSIAWCEWRVSLQTIQSTQETMFTLDACSLHSRLMRTLPWQREGSSPAWWSGHRWWQPLHGSWRWARE